MNERRRRFCRTIFSCLRSFRIVQYGEHVIQRQDGRTRRRGGVRNFASPAIGRNLFCDRLQLVFRL